MTLPHTPISQTPPEAGEFVKIHDCVYWIRMPLPMRLNHINLWALPDDGGWTLVDTGLHYPKCLDLWKPIIAKLEETGPIRRIICTHYHPDHAGNAGWLVEQTGAEFWMSEAEWLTAKMLLTIPTEIIGKKMFELAKLSGLPADKMEMLGNLGSHYQVSVGDLPRRYNRILDNMEFMINGISWKVIMGYGHAMEHACLYAKDAKVLIAGDHVLPEITPNISTHWFNGWTDPLGGFLDTNQTLLREVADDIIVLPSHRQPFHGLHQRLHELKLHHDDRLEEARKALRQRPNQTGQAADVLEIMFKMQLDGFGLMFAIGEAEAHLRHLVALGEAKLLGDPKDQNRPWLYQLI